jgi:hypothetical protein
MAAKMNPQDARKHVFRITVVHLEFENAIK